MITTNPLIAKFEYKDGRQRGNRVGVVDKESGKITDITDQVVQNASIKTIDRLLNWNDRLTRVGKALEKAQQEAANTISAAEVKLKTPLPDNMQIGCAGVTYKRSVVARNAESGAAQGLSPYDKVHLAMLNNGKKDGRPEIFYKQLAKDAAASGEVAGIREDAKWNVPESEFTIVLNSQGKVAGYTIGNDMSSRDIEGENPLYLPQAKVYHRSVAVGPYLLLTDANDDPTKIERDETEIKRDWKVELKILRGDQEVFNGETQVGQLAASFKQLKDYLLRSQYFPDGIALLTGTGIIPEDKFTLQDGDKMKITIGPMGTLVNEAQTIPNKLTKDKVAELAAIAA